MANDVYTSPLASRYASPYMLHLFSPDSRFQTWRRLWVALARAQHQLGLPITARQVQELEAHVTDIDYEVAADPAFGLTRPELEALMDPQRYIGRCPQQVARFLERCQPLLAQAQTADGTITL